jgi:hypothetical protein
MSDLTSAVNQYQMDRLVKEQLNEVRWRGELSLSPSIRSSSNLSEQELTRRAEHARSEVHRIAEMLGLQEIPAPPEHFPAPGPYQRHPQHEDLEVWLDELLERLQRAGRLPPRDDEEGFSGRLFWTETGPDGRDYDLGWTAYPWGPLPDGTPSMILTLHLGGGRLDGAGGDGFDLGLQREVVQKRVELPVAAE